MNNIPAPNRNATPRDALVDELCAAYDARIRLTAQPLCDGRSLFAGVMMSVSMFITFMMTLILFAEPSATWTPWATLVLTGLQAAASAILWSNVYFGRAVLKAEDRA